MKKAIGWIVLLLLVALLQGGCAPQTVEEHPTPTPTPIPMPATQELTPEQFVEKLITVAQTEDEQRLRQLVIDNPTTAVQTYQILLELGEGTEENAELYRFLASLLEQFPIVSALAQAENLNQQIVELDQQGCYAEAIPLAEQVLAIREKALDPEHPHVAASLNNLANLYCDMGEYADAEPLYRRTLAIREKVLGPEHPDVATSLNNLAELYKNMSEYAEAEPLYQRALAIREKILGSEHPDTATILNNLAMLYKDMGAYQQTEPLLQRALAIDEKALGPEHPHVAGDLNNLAGLYHDMGGYAQAEPLYQRALAIVEKVLGTEHPNVAEGLNNLAALYRDMGRYAQAEPLYQRALAIVEKVLGTEHPHVAASLNNLAELYRDIDGYAQAEPLYQRALAIVEKVLGPEHPDTATSLNNLALLYHDMGGYAQAEPLYQRALAIDEKALGPEHPGTATSLDNLAALYSALDRPDQAHSLHMRVQQIHAQLIEQIMGFTSERQKLNFLATLRGNLYGFLSLVNQHFSQNPSTRKDTFDVWLRRKGVVLEAQKRFQDALLYSDDLETVKTVQELAMVRAQLTHLAFAGPGKEDPEVYQQRLTELKDQKEQLEATLSRLSQAFAVSQKVAKADTSKIAAALPPPTALLDFARVPIFNFKAKGQEKKWQPAHYLAFILHAGNGDDVRLIDLGDADTIDQAVATLKRSIPRIASDPQGLKTVNAAKRLHELVFAPLTSGLGEVKDIFISPDGNLNLIPFEVLIGPDGRFLIEEYTFNYLAAGRDILGFGEIQEQGGAPLLMGDPDFDFAPGINARAESVSRLKPATEGASASLSFEPGALAPGEGNYTRSVDMRGFHFKRLPWTKKEVETIQTLLGDDQTALYTDKEALEEVLLQSEAPRILHLATHGFFLEDQDWQVFAQDAFLGRPAISLKPPGSQDFAWTPSVPSPPGRFENPLLRSGIALAGANTAAGEAGHTSGIVTAEKILGLKLRGTEMVVLSACETGLGDVQAGEGVFGLHRAFTQAGAKSLVMSMWTVPDKETQELMVQFYKNILSGKMTRCQALRQAALQQMQIVKDRYGYPHPLYWGAFVFMGKP